MKVRWRIEQGDLRTVDLSQFGTFDAVLCDPPYELGFMGKRWDSSGVAFDVEVWRKVFAALRPGAPLLAFGGTRTYHRMTCAIEDAGFEIRDCLSWLYGQGFPKSLDVSKAIDKAAGAVREVIGVKPGHEEFVGRTDAHAAGSTAAGWARPWQLDPEKVRAHHLATAPNTSAAAVWSGYGTALKPAWEPCVLARVPLEGTVAANVEAHGCGALAIDASRLGFASERDETKTKNRHADFGSNAPDRIAFGADDRPPVNYDASGRWPANVLLDDAAAAMLDEQSGERPSGIAVMRNGGGGKIFGTGGGRPMPDSGYRDEGGASRFFFTSKVSTSERNDGLDDLPELGARSMTGRAGDAPGNASPRAGAGRKGAAKNPHPTMKPVALTEYLARLILPPRGIGRPRRLLVPFAGVGSEVLGALRAGWDEIVGIELHADHVEIARLRLSRVDSSHQESLFA